MELESFLKSLSDSERNYISSLDYRDSRDKHRKELDIVIDNGGLVDFEKNYWFPYEVIELGYHVLKKGHEREFAACVGIVLKNIESGGGPGRDLEDVIDKNYCQIKKLPPDLKEMIDSMIQKMIGETDY